MCWQVVYRYTCVKEIPYPNFKGKPAEYASDRTDDFKIKGKRVEKLSHRCGQPIWVKGPEGSEFEDVTGDPYRDPRPAEISIHRCDRAQRTGHYCDEIAPNYIRVPDFVPVGRYCYYHEFYEARKFYSLVPYEGPAQRQNIPQQISSQQQYEQYIKQGKHVPRNQNKIQIITHEQYELLVSQRKHLLAHQRKQVEQYELYYAIQRQKALGFSGETKNQQTPASQASDSCGQLVKLPMKDTRYQAPAHSGQKRTFSERMSW